MQVVSFKNFDSTPKAKTIEQAEEPTEKYEIAKTIAASLMPTDWDEMVGKDMADKMRLAWNSVAPGLVLRNRLNDLFVIPLAELCYYKVQNDDLKKWLAENGMTYETITRNGLQHKNHPQVAQQNRVFELLMRCIGKFGLTPADEKLLQSTMQLDLEELTKNGFGTFAQSA